MTTLLSTLTQARVVVALKLPGMFVQRVIGDPHRA